MHNNCEIDIFTTISSQGAPGRQNEVETCLTKSLLQLIEAEWRIYTSVQ